MREKPITLNDIAKKLNYSIVTISKALRNHPDISDETKKLIKKVAEELGYTPNIMARNLSSRHSNTIGLVVPKIAHYFFGSIIEHIYNIGFASDYEIILMVSQEDAEREKKHIQTLLAMKVDGIIISISQNTTDYSVFELVKRRGVPLVFIDRIPEINGFNTVSVNDRQGAFRAIEHVINLGYKKIAHFAGPPTINIGRDRALGYVDAMAKYNLEINPGWYIEGDFSEKFGYDTFMKLYRENNLPEFIFTVTYPVALGVYMAAAELCLKIPEDIDIICFGNANVQRFLSPPLSCINQPTDKLSQIAMNLLLEKINDGENPEPKHIIIDTELELRSTAVFNHRKQ